MEIERKFLVDSEAWSIVEKGQGKRIKQGYFVSNEQFSVRVRTKGEKAFITIKGTRSGISRDEFEYEIPVDEAEYMLEQFAQPYLSKTRYEVIVGGKTWEIDEFEAPLQPLILAEIELDSEDESFEIPSWTTIEVSTDPQYMNSNIVKRLHKKSEH